MSTAFTSVAFAPFVPWWAIAALAALALLPVVFGLLRRARGTVWRAIMLALLLLALANPSLVEEQRRPQQDVALLVVHDTGSQTLGHPAAQRDADRHRAVLGKRVTGRANTG